MSLQIVTGPTAEPVTVDEVKARLRITSTNDDATIAAHITAAREFAEKETRRSLAYKSYALYLDRFPYPYEPIRVPVPPLVAVSAVKYLDPVTLVSTTWDPTEYLVSAVQSPGLIFPNPIAPTGRVYP